MKKVLIVILFLISIGTIATVILPRTILKAKPVHYHAGFQVYKDGKLQDFSDFKYMHEKPCTADGKPIEDPNPDEQMEKAHLHDNDGDVVHVHREKARWKDLFQNIKYPIGENVTGYVNGKKVDDILDQPITKDESVIFFIGKNPDETKLLKKAVTVQRIREVEKKSETCSAT